MRFFRLAAAAAASYQRFDRDIYEESSREWYGLSCW